MKKTTSNTLRALGKIGFSIATVSCVAAAIVVLSPEADEETAVPSVGVSESRADIFWGLEFERSHTQKFATALEKLGHEPPRVYDYNGNEVYFSTRVSHRGPSELLSEYQSAFVEEGVNSRRRMNSQSALLALPEGEARDKLLEEFNAAAVAGEIVPLQATNEYLSLSGMLLEMAQPSNAQKLAGAVLDKQAKKIDAAIERFDAAYKKCGGDPSKLRLDRVDPEGALRDIADRSEKASEQGCANGAGGGMCTEASARLGESSRKLQAYIAAIEASPELQNCDDIRVLALQGAHDAVDEFTEKLTAHRSIEAFRDPESGYTLVTASWSDEGFDMKKMLPEKYGFPEDARVNESVPACSSCQRAYAFLGNDNEAAYSKSTFWSTESVQQVSSDYRRLMATQGWSQLDAGPEEEKLLLGMEIPYEHGEDWLRFVRGDEHLSMRIFTNREKRTEVLVLSSN